MIVLSYGTIIVTQTQLQSTSALFYQSEALYVMGYNSGIGARSFHMSRETKNHSTGVVSVNFSGF